MDIETIFDKIVKKVCMDLIEYEWLEVPDQRMLMVKLNLGIIITNNSKSLDEKEKHYFHVFTRGLNYDPKNFMFHRDFDEKQVDSKINEIVDSLKSIEKFRLYYRINVCRVLKENSIKLKKEIY
jgi:hypothetical protein